MSASDTPTVTFVTPWLPQYRRKFFEALRSRLIQEDVTLRLRYGPPPPEFKSRGDAIDLEWAEPYDEHRRVLGPISLTRPPFVRRGEADLVIFEQHAKQLTLYPQLLAGRTGLGPPVGLWGHGDASRTVSSPVSSWIRRMLIRAPALWFVYTSAGGDHLAEAGFASQNMTVFNNTVDVDDLVDAVGPLEQRQSDIRRDLGLGDGLIALHIGGLDAAKRLDLLVTTADRLRSNRPDFELVVAGAGSEEELIRSAADSRPWLHYVGPVFDQRKAQLFAAADFLLHPGKVGLVVIDSFATGTPLVVADGQTQAPEYDYLNASNAIIAPSADPATISNTVTRVFSDLDRLSGIAAGARSAYTSYSPAEMVDRVATGIITFLGDRRPDARNPLE